MKIITDIYDFSSFAPSVVTIGTFDGVHIGHQKILERVVQAAEKENLIPSVFTFFPHPRIVLRPNEPIKLLQTIEERAQILENKGIEQLIIQPFDQKFANLSAQEFVENILHKKLNAKKIIIGYDHRFGKNRSANITDLREFAKKYHFEVEEISAQEISDISVSSTKIRNALINGNIQIANQYLGYSFSLTGKVIHGMKLGRTLGFPTANIQIEDSYKIIPKIGVYLVYSIFDGKKIFGMLSIGKNPTIANKGESIEVHFFDFNKDLYDQSISIYFLEYLREEQKFSDIEALKKQLALDEEVCRKLMQKY
ncbi:MAG: bifunctional riboflavin kinase/FAD synthetase [Capnocytophaga sp.]|nr:bifunctional riboflavin kinase/FAD synthetase [Capnocytophaga sp.]